jgi:hypothetical protein
MIHGSFQASLGNCLKIEYYYLAVVALDMTARDTWFGTFGSRAIQ